MGAAAPAAPRTCPATRSSAHACQHVSSGIPATKSSTPRAHSGKRIKEPGQVHAQTKHAFPHMYVVRTHSCREGASRTSPIKPVCPSLHSHNEISVNGMYQRPGLRMAMTVAAMKSTHMLSAHIIFVSTLNTEHRCKPTTESIWMHPYVFWVHTCACVRIYRHITQCGHCVYVPGLQSASQNI